MSCGCPLSRSWPLSAATDAGVLQLPPGSSLAPAPIPSVDRSVTTSDGKLVCSVPDSERLAHQLGNSGTLSPQALPAALLTQTLHLPPNQQGDGNLVTDLAAEQYGCLLGCSRASRLAESVRDEQEVRTLLHRGKVNMPEMRERLRMDVEPDHHHDA